MSDPLSITASVIAVTTFGLQSTRFIYETLSSLCKSREEFALADESLQTLLRTLDQTRRLTLAPQSSLLLSPLANSSTNSTLDDELFFKELETIVKKCGDELKPLVTKVKKWKAAESGKNRVVSAVKWHIRDSDLRKIHEIVSRQIQLLNIQFSIAGCAQIANHSNSTRTATASASTQLTDLSAEIKHSMRFSTAHLSKCLDQTYVTLNRNHGDLTDAIKNNSAIQQDHFRGLRNVEQSVAASFNDQSQVQARILNEILELRRQLNGTKEKKESDEFDQNLQDCIDRLYDLKDSGRVDLDIGSSEAQLIQESVVSILKALLKEISFPRPWEVDRKRKRAAEGEYQEATDAEDKRIEEMRITKKMRGILDSSQTIQFRDSNLQKDRVIPGRKVQSHNRIWETPAGTLAIMAAVLEPSLSDTQTLLKSETVTQAFAGSLTLIPKTKGRKMKLRAFFAQQITRNGAFSFAPTLSFHAIMPNNSPVFQLVRSGDLEGLKKLLQDGLASLTDCDMEGRSLISYALRSLTDDYGVKSYPHICEYLLSKGADFNGFETYGGSGNEMVPLLGLPMINFQEESQEYRANTIYCARLLLAAGADPSLFLLEGTNGYDLTPLMWAVVGQDMGLLRVILDHGGALLNLELREGSGDTALLSALKNSLYPVSSLIQDCVEISFEQANLLIDRGASCLASNQHRNNCLHILLSNKAYYRRHFVLRPYQILTRLLVRILQAGADVYAENISGYSPSDLARDNTYEFGWRQALSKCGYCPQEVYQKSGVEWEELPDINPEMELIELFAYIYGPPFMPFERRQWSPWEIQRQLGRGRKIQGQWSPGKIQELLVEVIQSSVDLFKCVSPSGTTISHFASVYHADRQFREALEVCGFDPKEVYSKSGAPWVELEDIEYEYPRDSEDADRQFREALELCGFDPKGVYFKSGAPWVELEDLEDEYDRDSEDSEESEEDEGSEEREGSEEEEGSEEQEGSEEEEGSEEGEDSEGEESDEESAANENEEYEAIENEIGQLPAFEFEQSGVFQQSDSHHVFSLEERSSYDGHFRGPNPAAGAVAIPSAEGQDLGYPNWINTNQGHDNHWRFDGHQPDNNNPWTPQDNLAITRSMVDGLNSEFLAQTASMDFTYESEVWGDSGMS